MSIQAMTAAFDTPAPSPTIKLLLITLGNYAHGRDSWCFPSQQTLATDTGLSERAIRDNLKTMEDAGLIRRETRRRKDGSKTSDLIYLLFLQPAETAASLPTPADAAGGHRQMAPSSPAPAAGHEREEEKGEEQRADERDLFGAGQKQEGNPPPEETPVQAAYRLYNELAARLPNAAKATDLTDSRRQSIKARLNGEGLPKWERALKALESNRFLCGEVEGSRGRFKLTLDFILRPSTFQKLIEGAYEVDRLPVSTAFNPDAWPEVRWERVMAAWRDDRSWPTSAGPPPGAAGCNVPAHLLQRPS